MFRLPVVTSVNAVWRAFARAPVGDVHFRAMHLPTLEAMSGRLAQTPQQSHGVLEGDRAEFSLIRKALRVHGLPIAQEQSAIRFLFDSFIQTVTLQDARALDLKSLPSSQLVGLYHDKLFWSTVPDPILDALLERQQDPVVRQALYHVAQNQPLRLYSELGMAFFLNAYQDMSSSDRANTLDRLFFKEQKDGRVIPFVAALAPFYKDFDEGSHMKVLPRLSDRFPIIGELYFQKYVSVNDASYPRRLFRSSFSKTGAKRGADPKAAFYAWDSYLKQDPDKALKELETLKLKAQTRSADVIDPHKYQGRNISWTHMVPWREYHMLRTIYEIDEAALDPILDFSAHLLRTDWVSNIKMSMFDSWSTPLIVDLLLRIESLSKDVVKFKSLRSDLLAYLLKERSQDLLPFSCSHKFPLVYIFGEEAVLDSPLLSDLSGL